MVIFFGVVFVNKCTYIISEKKEKVFDELNYDIVDKKKVDSCLGLRRCLSSVFIDRPVSLVWVFEANVVVVDGHHKHGDVIAYNAAKFSVWAPAKLNTWVHIVHFDLYWC